MEYPTGRQPPPPPPPGGRPAPQVVVVSGKTNGLAVASLVLGIVWIYWIGSILALVFGYMAKSQIEQSGGREQGAGLATAGIILGWIGVGTLSLFIVFIVFGVMGTFWF
jgi:hypothetical protein